MLLPVAAVAVFAAVAIGRPIVVPEGIKTRLEQTLARQLPGLDVELGEVSLVLQDNFDPTIRVRNLELSASDNTGSVDFAQLEARMSFGALTEGQIAPRDIRISGVFLTVIRQGDGSFNVSVGQGEGSDTFGQATQITTLGDQIEGFLERPFLSSLDSFVLEDMTLRYEDVRARQGWTVDSGLLQLQRDGKDVTISTQLLLLAGREYATSIEGFLNTAFDTPETQFGLNFEDMPSDGLASQTAALAWLGILRAPISGSLRGETDQDGKLGAVNAALQIGEGVLQPSDGVQPVPFEGLRSYLTYDPVREAITFDELSLDSKLIRATASGQALLRDMQQGLPGELLVQLELSRFEANPKELEHAPLVLDRSFMDFRLRLNPFELDLGQLLVNHGGYRLMLSGGLETTETQWDYALDGHSDGVEAARLLLIWPDEFKPKLRKWIDENILKVDLHDINLAIRSQQQAPPDVYVDFQFSEADIRVLKTMPPVRGASGFASLVRNQFRVAAEKGTVYAEQGGAVDVSGTGFIVENTRLKQSPARATVKASGSVTAAMSLLDRKPLQVFTKAKLPVDLAEGSAKVTGEARFVMKDKLPAEEVAFEARGVLRDVTTSHFIKDKEIRADLRVHANNEQVALWGDGTIGALPFDGRWSTKLGKENGGRSVMTGTAELSARAVEEFRIGLPPGTVSGEGRATYEIQFEKDIPPRLTVSSDLSGVDLRAPPLGWRKRPDKTGSLDVAVTLASPPIIESIALDAGGLKATGDVALKEDGGLDVLRLASFEVGRWLRGTGEMRGRGANRSPSVHVNSGTFDMRYKPTSAAGASGGQSQPITARLDRVQVTDTIYLENVQADLDTGAGVSGNFAGAFMGTAPVSGTLYPHENGVALKVTSPQGGAMAARMGVVKAATRGALEMTLIPLKAPGVYDGRLQIDSIKVQQVPLIAELLNAISVIGLIEQLDGPGLLFIDVFSRFRLTPQQIIIAESSAVGPSLGISADGTYTFDGSRFDIQGAISPIYSVNFIGRAISRRGEGLIGFNYTMRGPSSDPVISINPLSALTPGFFREIFRRPPPKLNN